MGCCQPKESNTIIDKEANLNLENGTKKDDENVKVTVATVKKTI